MKKLLKTMLLSIMIFNLVGCVFRNSNYEEQTENTQQNEKIDLNKFKDSLAYNIMQNAWDYTNKNNIPINNFLERKDLLEFLKINDMQQILDTGIKVEEKTKLFSSVKRYKKTLDESNFIYYGSLNSDNQPSGLGILLEYSYLYEYDNGYLIRYIGHFEDGTYNGYGIEPQIIKIQGQDSSQKTILAEEPTIYCSADIHEGYFEDGIANGLGNNYSKVGQSDEILYCTTIGEFGDGTWNGEISYYWLNVLHYQGNTNNGDYDGQGTLYFRDTGKIEYKGEFSNGEYHGDGTLYDEKGNILHDGEFSYGDIK